MKKRRMLALTIAFTMALGLVPAPAHAVEGPSLSATTVRAEGFEGAPGSDLTIEDAVLIPPAVAWWGPVTNRAYSGSHGLWCAGSGPSGGWTGNGGIYPDFTYGLATFDLPQLADYYSASLSYRYTMPSVGVEDGDSFNVLWFANANEGLKDYHYALPLTGTGVWNLDTRGLTATSNRVNLSRTAGSVRFQFVDMSEGFGESPTTGEGPTIDDVSITGYKFGPVRGLAAGTVAGHVHLSWSAPWRSTAATSTEERPVAYRVWRSADSAPYAWTELTTSRIAGSTFDDPDSITGTYRYAVQAWDPGSGTGFGQESVPGDTVAINVTAPAPPTAPSGIALADGGAPAPRIHVTWSDNSSDEVGFVVQRAADSSLDAAFSTVATLSAGTTSYTDGSISWALTYYYRVRSYSASGASAWVASTGMRLDTAPPVTTSSSDSAWHTSPVSVTLGASDDKSGVAATYYTLSGSSQAGYSGPFLVSAQGTTSFVFHSVDAAGNVEADRPGSVKIDSIAPFTASDAGPTYTSAASIHLTPTDSSSGVSDTFYRLDGASALSGTTVNTSVIGSHLLSFWSVDAAGNFEDARIVTFQVTSTGGGPGPDTIAPMTSATISGSPISAGWYASGVSVVLAASDPAPSQGPVTTYYSLDGAAATAYTAALAISSDAAHTLSYWSVDGAGNAESAHAATIRIDSHPPITSCDALASYTGTATIHMTPTDTLSGVASTRYSLDGAPAVSATLLTVTASGSHQLSYSSQDVAGNREATRATSFSIAPAAKLPTSITITRSTSSVRLPKPFILQGVLRPGHVGDPCGVEVKKPGSARWSYSSARLAYSTASGGGANWWYRYTPKLRGTYTFRVKFPGDGTRLSCISPNTVAVTVK